MDQYEKYRKKYLAALEKYKSTNDKEYFNRLMSIKAKFEKMPNFSDRLYSIMLMLLKIFQILRT